jgi:hypothetical protein
VSRDVAHDGAMLDEVRSCRRCREAALVPYRRYESAVLLGTVRTGHVAATDYVCQACGAVCSLRPGGGILRAVVGGTFAVQLALLGGALSLSAAFAAAGGDFDVVASVSPALLVAFAAVLGAWAFHPWWLEKTQPIVSGAPVPPLRFHLRDTPIRRCRCGKAAAVRGITSRRIGPFPGGKEYEYACAGCGATFGIDSPWNAALAIGLGLVFAVPAMVGLAYAEDWETGLCAGAVLLLGAGSVALASVRLLNRRRHPVMAAEQPG